MVQVWGSGFIGVQGQVCLFGGLRSGLGVEGSALELRVYRVSGFRFMVYGGFGSRKDHGKKTGFHTVEFEGFVASDIQGLRDQICSAQGPKANCGMQVDFRRKGRTPPCGLGG